MVQAYKYNKVLVIDDTTLDRFIADRLMKLCDFAIEIECMNSASAALAYLGDDHAELPELIFLDLNMPGMSGFQFLKEYKKLPEHRKRRSIVMLTSSVLEEDKSYALSDEHVVSFIVKPLNKDVLRQLSALQFAALSA